MNLIEAIKSGKRFRHKNSSIWLSQKNNPYIRFCGDDLDSWVSEFKSLIEDCWEIEEPKIEITEAQLKKAWDGLFLDSFIYRIKSNSQPMLFQDAFPLLAAKLFGDKK